MVSFNQPTAAWSSPAHHELAECFRVDFPQEIDVFVVIVVEDDNQQHAAARQWRISSTWKSAVGLAMLMVLID